MEQISAQLIRRLDKVFPGYVVKPSACIEWSNAENIYIDDNVDKGYCIFVPFEDGDDFTMVRIIDKNKTEKALFAYDGKFVKKGHGSKRCDAIVFNNAVLCFIEIKLNVSLDADKTSIANNRKKGLAQLESVILKIKSLFEEKDYLPIGYERRAYLCTPPKYPRHGTSIESEQVRFWDNYHVELKESNIITL